MTIAELVEKAHGTAVEKGWYDDGERNTGELIALVHSELSEALECARNGEPAFHIVNGKPEGIAVELADAIIRICDMAGHKGLDLQAAIVAKLAYNDTRPHKHGKKF